MIKRKLKKLLEILKNIIKAAIDELYQIQHEELFLHHWRDKKWKLKTVSKIDKFYSLTQ